MDRMVVDLSHHNTVTSFAEVKAAGIIGVIHKATEGTSFRDKTYAAREKAARAVGLEWGCYHFLKHGQAAKQMDWFLGIALPAAGSRVAIDFEDELSDLDDLHEAIRRIQTVDRSLQIAIYGGSMLKSLLGNSVDPILAPHALWLAQYTAKQPSWPDETWPAWTLWQYTDGAVGGTPRVVPGIGPCDCNTFNGSRANCKKWFNSASSEPLTVPAPIGEVAPAEILIRITAPAGIAVRLLVNGEER